MEPLLCTARDGPPGIAWYPMHYQYSWGFEAVSHLQPSLSRAAAFHLLRCSLHHVQVGRFLVDDLGMLGLFGHYFRSVPRRLLEEEPRLAWQVNNGPAGGWNFSSHNVSMQLPGWTWPPNAECDSQAQATLCVTTTRLSMA